MVVKVLSRVNPVIRRKFDYDFWNWNYQPAHKRWETYCNPLDWPEDLYQWLLDTFGRPAESNGWDMHGGWIYITREDYLMMFKLRWS